MLGSGVPVELEIWFYILSIVVLLGGAGVGAYKWAVKSGQRAQVQLDQLDIQKKLVKSVDGMRDDFRQHLESDDERFRTMSERISRLEPTRGR